MRETALIAQIALIKTLQVIHPGMSEKQIASELVIAFIAPAPDINLPFEPIVSSESQYSQPARRTLRAHPSGGRLPFRLGCW